MKESKEGHLTTYFLKKYLFALKEVYLVYMSKYLFKIQFLEKDVFLPAIWAVPIL